MTVKNDRVYKREISFEKIDYESKDGSKIVDEESDFHSITKSSVPRVHHKKTFSLDLRKLPVSRNSLKDLHIQIQEQEEEASKNEFSRGTKSKSISMKRSIFHPQEESRPILPKLHLTIPQENISL